MPLARKLRIQFPSALSLLVKQAGSPGTKGCLEGTGCGERASQCLILTLPVLREISQI